MQIMFTLRFIQLGFCFEIDVSSSNCCFQFFLFLILNIFINCFISTTHRLKLLSELFFTVTVYSYKYSYSYNYSYKLQLRARFSLNYMQCITVCLKQKLTIIGILSCSCYTIRYTYNRFQVHSLQTFRKQRSVYELN